MTYYVSFYPSPIGKLKIVSTQESIVGLWMETQPQKAFDDLQCGDELPVIRLCCRWLDIYFSGKDPNMHLPPLCPEGTKFQKRVWNILKDIPYGQTTTYGQIASVICQQSGLAKMSAQAVGQAVGANPISILIPCHRVLGAGNQLTGYNGGIHLKHYLLSSEGIEI